VLLLFSCIFLSASLLFSSPFARNPFACPPHRTVFPSYRSLSLFSIRDLLFASSRCWWGLDSRLGFRYLPPFPGGGGESGEGEGLLRYTAESSASYRCNTFANESRKLESSSLVAFSRETREAVPYLDFPLSRAWTFYKRGWNKVRNPDSVFRLRVVILSSSFSLFASCFVHPYDCHVFLILLRIILCIFVCCNFHFDLRLTSEPSRFLPLILPSIASGTAISFDELSKFETTFSDRVRERERGREREREGEVGCASYIVRRYISLARRDTRHEIFTLQIHVWLICIRVHTYLRVLPFSFSRSINSKTSRLGILRFSSRIDSDCTLALPLWMQRREFCATVTWHRKRKKDFWSRRPRFKSECQYNSPRNCHVKFPSSLVHASAFGGRWFIQHDSWFESMSVKRFAEKFSSRGNDIFFREQWTHAK